MVRYSNAESQHRTGSQRFLKFVGSLALILASFLNLGLALAASDTKGLELIDRVVVIVNGQAILDSEIKQKVGVGPLVMVSPFPSTDKASEYDQALNDAINFKLILKKTEALDITVSEEEIDQRIEDFLKANNLSKDQLIGYLRERDQTWEDYKRDYSQQMLVRRFQGRVIQPMVSITEKDLEAYYIKKVGNMEKIVEADIRQLLLSVPTGSDASVAEAKEKIAREVYEKLKGGLDFADAVRLYSDEEGSKETLGLMKNVRIADLNSTIQNAVKNLAPGDFTAPVKSSLGFHIFYMEKFHFKKTDEYEKNKKHLEEELMMQQLSTSLNKWLETERRRAKLQYISL